MIHEKFHITNFILTWVPYKYKWFLWNKRVVQGNLEKSYIMQSLDGFIWTPLYPIQNKVIQ